MQIRNVYGIDLGTSTVKIYDLKKDTKIGRAHV